MITKVKTFFQRLFLPVAYLIGLIILLFGLPELIHELKADEKTPREIIR